MDVSAAGVVGVRRARRFRSVEERCQIVEETLVPGVSVATVARAHELNANVVFHWRKLYRAGVLVREAGMRDEQRMLPVTVSGVCCGEASNFAASSIFESAASPGSIELTLAKGQARIVGVADPATLRVVLESLAG